MTIKQLKKYHSIKVQMNVLKANLYDLIVRSAGGVGAGVKGSGTSNPVADISEKRAKLDERIKKLQAELDEIEAYINGCEECIGIMLKWHYIQGKSWTSIVPRTGGNNTEDSVRMMCHRYVRRNS